MPEPELHKIHVNGVQLAYFERNRPEAGRPTLLFAHATGFHGRVWDRIIKSFPDHHSIAFEQRGHGRSEKRTIKHWQVVGEDLAALIAALGLTDMIGIGHSMGAHAMVDAAATVNGAFARMVLLDPTIAEPGAYANEGRAFRFEGGVHPVARRRNEFKSVDEMMAHLAKKSAFPLFDRQVFKDYCVYGLVPCAKGGLELACPPEVEASIYMAVRTNTEIFDQVAKVNVPVLIVRAQAPKAERGPMDFSSSPTWPGLVNEFPQGRETHYPDITHFIPMQVPERVVQILQEEIRAWHDDGKAHSARH